MAGMAAKLARDREAAAGLGSHERAVKYLNQDYEALRAECLEAGAPFQDPSFPAVPAALGFKELGPHSGKTRGIVWKRPPVGAQAPGCGVRGGGVRGGERARTARSPPMARIPGAAGPAPPAPRLGGHCSPIPLRGSPPGTPQTLGWRRGPGNNFSGTPGGQTVGDGAEGPGGRQLLRGKSVCGRSRRCPGRGRPRSAVTKGCLLRPRLG